MEAALSKVNEFDSGTTIVGSVYVAPSPYPYAPDWRRLMYYLPEYRVLMLQVNAGESYLDAKDHSFSAVDGSFITMDEDVTKAIFIGMKPARASVELVPVQEISGYAPVNVANIPPAGWIEVGPFRFAK